MAEGMTIIEAVTVTGLPFRLLKRLQKDGIIGDPLSSDEVKGLAIIKAMWGRQEYAREFARQIRPARRAAMLLTADLDRADRYILKCYLNLSEGERLSVQEVVSRVQKYLGFKVAPDKVRRVRQIAYDLRQGKRKQLAEAFKRNPDHFSREKRTR